MAADFDENERGDKSDSDILNADDGRFDPFLGHFLSQAAQGCIEVSFSGLDGSGAVGSVSPGVSLETLNAWSIDVSLLRNIEGSGQKSAGAKIGVGGRF